MFRSPNFLPRAIGIRSRPADVALACESGAGSLVSPRMEAPDWSSLSDDELLERKISQLGLKLDGPKLQPLIQQLYEELSQKGLTFHPPCHLGDEWFVPVGLPAIFIPFFLTHDRLRQLERKIILEVEGGTPEWFMKLIRHEAAHAYAYAYPFVRKRQWQRVFGKSSTDETPSFYRPRPYSHSFVVHLDDWYAQSHPDEDFAETFAVWLTPGLDWRAKYRGWRALEKLEYVDELMRSLAGKPPLPPPECGWPTTTVSTSSSRPTTPGNARNTRTRSRISTTTICGSSLTPARKPRAASRPRPICAGLPPRTGKRDHQVVQRKQISRQQTPRQID